jgi:protein TonB
MRRPVMAASTVGRVVQDNELRLLETAIAVSIVLHVIAFSLLHAVTPKVNMAAASLGAISARLVEPTLLTPPTPPAPATPAAPRIEPTVASTSVDLKRKPAVRLENQATPEPLIERKPRMTVREETKSTPAPKPKTRITNARGANATQTTKPTPASPSPASQPLPTQYGPVASAAPQPAPPPSAPAIDADLLARYRLQLIDAARRYKRYPRAAQDNQWEGAVEVAMVIGANGTIRALSINKTSGHVVLDRQAIDMFREAMPLVPIPGALRGREFRVTVKAIYSLREPDA